VYAVVGVTALLVGGPDLLAGSASPLAAAADAAGRDALEPVIRAGAALASLGALLALMAGIGRTALAMARGRDLPGWLGAVHPRFRVPHHAEVALALVVIVLVLSTDLRGALGFSSFGSSSTTRSPTPRRTPNPRPTAAGRRGLNVLGVAGCLVLAATLPLRSVVAGLVIVAVGLLARLSVRRIGNRSWSG